ncbi:MAG: tRNA (adenosine(37)-N6)-threonylcarbamoyltransferase complex ATPase subunit type 1 TsaE [Spirochaetaceae bacterium]|nr:tRNA (adenosine(37)-N6)-threonylcarbamoyltransferase complex ATPase subunit type 1 TsaE [Spirochaetaceae bacterium]
MVTFHSTRPEDTENWGRILSEKLTAGAVIGLTGSLGAGKSVVTRGIARGLGIEGPITSPTYTLISEYHQGRLSLYHMDLYRIEDPEEFELLGAQELIYGQGICIIEWYQLIEDLLPEDLIIIDLQIEQDGSRTIRMNKDL